MPVAIINSLSLGAFSSIYRLVEIFDLALKLKSGYVVFIMKMLKLNNKTKNNSLQPFGH